MSIHKVHMSVSLQCDNCDAKADWLINAAINGMALCNSCMEQLDGEFVLWRGDGK